MLLFRYVPVVKITVLPLICSPDCKTTPETLSPSVIKESTSASLRSRLLVFFNTFNMILGYLILSICALKALTAGPFDAFSILICICPLSELFAISPPSASISLTTIPFAGPPMEGLQGKEATRLRLPVINTVRLPIRAIASAASIPACPPPTIIPS
jgi:hypothetical protein